MNTGETLAILVGGGPAPGINGVIASATIEARNHGLRVLGIYEGYRHLVRGDISHVAELQIEDVSRLHFSGGSMLRTSRTNPAASNWRVHHANDAIVRWPSIGAPSSSR